MTTTLPLEIGLLYMYINTCIPRHRIISSCYAPASRETCPKINKLCACDHMPCVLFLVGHPPWSQDAYKRLESDQTARVPIQPKTFFLWPDSSSASLQTVAAHLRPM